MIMKKLLQILFFSLLCFACSSEKQQQSKDFIEIDMIPLIEGKAKEMPLQEWAKSVRFIPLEINEGALTSPINNVFQHGDTILVYQWQRLSVFDKNGKYLYDIGSEGMGPEEFVLARAVVLHNDLIYVHEFNGKVKVYDWKGNFVKKLDLPSNVWEVLTISGQEEMLAYVANQNGKETVRFYRMKGEKVLDSIPNPFRYRLPMGNWIVDYSDELHRTSGLLNAFMEMNSDTLYQLDEHLHTHPYIVFNMGKYLFTRKERYNIISDEIWELMEKKFNLKVTGELNDKVYFFNDRKQNIERTRPHIGEIFCYDKNTEETSKCFLTYGENDWGILPDASFVPRTIFDDKYLVDWEQPDNEDNPVLILVEP